MSELVLVELYLQYGRQFMATKNYVMNKLAAVSGISFPHLLLRIIVY